MKPHASYEDWKESTNTFYLSNGKVLAKVKIVDLWMLPNGTPHALNGIYRGKEINIPFDKVMYYVINTNEA